MIRILWIEVDGKNRNLQTNPSYKEPEKKAIVIDECLVDSHSVVIYYETIANLD